MNPFGLVLTGVRSGTDGDRRHASADGGLGARHHQLEGTHDDLPRAPRHARGAPEAGAVGWSPLGAVGLPLKGDRTSPLNRDLEEDHLILALVWEPAKHFDAQDAATPWCPQDFVLSEFTGHRGQRPIVAVTASRSTKQ